MICPKCGSEDVCVIDTRSYEGSVFRKRKCKTCKAKFCTEEYVMCDNTEYNAACVALKHAREDKKKDI